MPQTSQRILALDPGQARIGVALYEPESGLVRPLAVIKRLNRDRDVAAVAELARAHGVALLVVGLPLTSSGEEGPAAQKARSFAKRMGRFCGLPVAMVDEWQTTVEAHELLMESDLSRQKRRQMVDKVAAALILERYLKGLAD